MMGDENENESENVGGEMRWIVMDETYPPEMANVRPSIFIFEEKLQTRGCYEEN